VEGARDFQKEGDSWVRRAKSYKQVKCPRGGSVPKHSPMKSTEMSTEKSTKIPLKSPNGGAYL
jgi:hypothetical protein